MKILVDAPTGEQQVIDVGQGGGYFDLSRVLWDERVDGPLPVITIGGMTRVNKSLVFSQARMNEHTEAIKPPVPKSVTRAQGLAALEMAGKLSTIEAFMSDPATPKLMKIAFNEAQSFERDSPSLLALVAQLGMTEAEVDTLFIEASKVRL